MAPRTLGTKGLTSEMSSIFTGVSITYQASTRQAQWQAMRIPVPVSLHSLIHRAQRNLDQLTAGVGATKIVPQWSVDDVRAAQRADPGISRLMQSLAAAKKQPEVKEEWTEDGELRRYRQLWSQMEIVDGVLHRRVEKGTRDNWLVLVVP